MSKIFAGLYTHHSEDYQSKVLWFLAAAALHPRQALGEGEHFFHQKFPQRAVGVKEIFDEKNVVEEGVVGRQSG